MFHIEQPFWGIFLIKIPVYTDPRGSFMVNYSFSELSDVIPLLFVQENTSISHRNVFRGLHYQIKNPQGKLIRVLSGAIIDYALDLRKESPTYGQIFYTTLTSEENTMLYISPGFAHGFVSLEDHTMVNYKCTKSYCPKVERGISYLKIAKLLPLSVDQLILSEKDKSWPTNIEGV